MIRHPDPGTLTPADQELLQAASRFLLHAYAPYSGFRVGAAIRTAKNDVVGGANQENASYPLCMCGERVALYNTSIQHPGEQIDTVAIVVKGPRELHSPAPPCGACLQVIREYESRQDEHPIRILLKADKAEVLEYDTVKELLPYSFDGSFL